jgi:ATP-dependent helicase YprA (DUF1998 family)
VNVFELDRTLVSDYERFARSFTKIRAPDIRQQVQDIYASDRFWPEPLVSINPRFEPGASIDQLVRAGTLREETARVFSIDGKALSLYRHQAQAVAKAATGQSFVVTTGTGSGKSLCFFIPIIDTAIRARISGEPKRTPVSFSPWRNPVKSQDEGAPICSNPITGISVRCARAASGQAAAPPSAAMNARRAMVAVICLPRFSSRRQTVP